MTPSARFSRLGRRDAITTLAGGGAGLAALLFDNSAYRPPFAADPSEVAVDCREVVLAAEPREGRRLREFVPTGLHGGHVFCTPTKSHPANPAVASVFAEPAEGLGVELVVTFLREPSGPITLSVMHVARHAKAATA